MGWWYLFAFITYHYKYETWSIFTKNEISRRDYRKFEAQNKIPSRENGWVVISLWQMTQLFNVIPVKTYQNIKMYKFWTTLLLSFIVTMATNSMTIIDELYSSQRLSSQIPIVVAGAPYNSPTLCCSGIWRCLSSHTYMSSPEMPPWHEAGSNLQPLCPLDHADRTLMVPWWYTISRKKID